MLLFFKNDKAQKDLSYQYTYSSLKYLMVTVIYNYYQCFYGHHIIGSILMIIFVQSTYHKFCANCSISSHKERLSLSILFSKHHTVIFWPFLLFVSQCFALTIWQTLQHYTSSLFVVNLCNNRKLLLYIHQTFTR